MKPVILFFLFLIHCFANGTKLSVQNTNHSLLQNSMTKKKEPTSEFNKKTPQAKGVILKFHNWPNENDKTLILTKLTQVGLTRKSEIQRFKIWIFEWSEQSEAEKAKNICKNLSHSFSLIYCKPDYLVKLDNIDNLPLTTSNENGNLKSCNIVDSKLGLSERKLSDYWAQEMIGADLIKEEIQQLPPVKKHFMECFDRESHGIAVKNLISDEGKHSVLPEIGKSMKVSPTYVASDFLKNSDNMLNKVDKTCGTAPKAK